LSRKLRPSEEISKKLQRIISGELPELWQDFFRHSMEHILQQALEEEVNDFLERPWHARRDGRGREGYRNGYYPRQLRSTEGPLKVSVPRLRQTQESFESILLKRVAALEEKLKKLSVELYVRGLSTRDIEQTFIDDEQRTFMSKSSVSRLADKLYEEYEAFSRRDLSTYDVVYLFADGVYESVRRYTDNQTLLCAWAICSDGRKVLLHLAAAESESADAWSDFFQEMMDRGLRQPLLVTSDGGKGLLKALGRHFPQARRQRCLAHKMRNLLNKLPRHVQQEIKEQIKEIYYASEKESAEMLAARLIDRHATNYPAMVACFQDDLSACLAHLEFPQGQRKLIRTTNLIERSFVEEKRRTKIIPQHINERGAVKLVFATLYRAAQRWQRVTISDTDMAILRSIKKTMAPKQNDEKISYEIAA